MLVQGDLTVIRSLLNLDWNIVREFYDPERPCVCSLTPPIEEDGRACHLREALKFADSLSESVKSWKIITAYISAVFGQYRAFLWNGSLQGIKGARSDYLRRAHRLRHPAAAAHTEYRNLLWKAKGPIMSFCTETRERENPPASRLF